jgi:hypothetical protein
MHKNTIIKQIKDIDFSLVILFFPVKNEKIINTKNKTVEQNTVQYHLGVICSFTKSGVVRNKLPAHKQKKRKVDIISF